MIKILQKIFIIQALSKQINAQMSSFCVCGQIQDSEQCEKSSICQWSESKCKIRNGLKYVEIESLEKQCKEYSQEDCRLQDNCGFYLGECIDFKECSLFKREECIESSQKCVSDGMQCIDVDECEKYINWNACQNRDKVNRYCFWSITENPKCRLSRECNELPLYLSNDFQCREQISTCTVSQYGGCVESEEECGKIKFDKQCYYNKAKSQKCYWDYDLSICLELVCGNLKFTSDFECRSQLLECTTNGFTCVLRQECKDSKLIEGCVTDQNGNKCIFINNECKKKECSLAEDVDIYSNYIKCQQFDFDLDCVYKNGGGCKDRPYECEFYDAQDDCLSIQNQNCFWSDNQCKKKGCLNQLLSLNHYQCKQIEKCMGKFGGGCQDRPLTCNLINQSQFCELDYYNRNCYWNSYQCVENICSNFYFPDFSNHLQCFTVNNKCTYDYYLGVCKDYNCQTLHQNDCLTNPLCKLSKRCKLKQCSDAPVSLITNTDCELWLKKCTVKVYQISTVYQFHGCVEKLQNCNDYHQNQCYTTIDGYQCKWIGTSCTSKVCSDFLTSSEIVCINLKVKGMKCLINSSNTACVQWPTTCSGFSDITYCTQGLIDGTKCLWIGTSCVLKDCSLSSGASTNYQCGQWNPICNYDISTSQCKQRDLNDTCSMTIVFTQKNHQECNAWNILCTENLTGAVGCQRKQYSCSKYNNQLKCVNNYYGVKCEWNTTTNQCQDYTLTSCPGSLDLKFANELCEQISISCLNLNLACEPLNTECLWYTFEKQCKINAYYEPCVWNGNSCGDLQCSAQTTATNDSDCFNYFNSPRNCQQKVKIDGTREVGCEVMTLCSQIINEDKCNQSVSRNEISCKFIGGVCIEQQQNNSQNCHLNVSATTNYECKQINDICELNYRNGRGCTAKSCSSITNSITCVLQQPKGTSCSWDSTTTKCLTNSCSFYTINTNCISAYNDTNTKCYWCDNRCVDSNYCQEVINDYHKECNNKNKLYTVSRIQTCGLVQPNCFDYSSYSACKYTQNETKCLFVWASTTSPYIPTSGTCNTLCSSLTNQSTCQANPIYCQWLGISCSPVHRNCSDYNVSDCDMAITRSGTKCTFNINSQCVERICSNYKNGLNRQPNNQSDCDNWLDNCVFVTNKCIDACQLISGSNTYTITICEQQRPNKVCTIGDEPKCGTFVQYCSQALQNQCYFDVNQRKCYWNTDLLKCFELNACNIFDSSNNNHMKCNTLLDSCTVNHSQNGCINLTDCHNYNHSFQCYINQNNDKCFWDIDKCITIECNFYTDQTNCENALFQSDLNKKCVWDQINIKCILLDCNNLFIDQTHNCSDYTQYCINESCKTIDCEDFQYDNEIQCSQLFTDKHCTTNGQSCIKRSNCIDCHQQICCNLNINLNECIWIQGQCYDRTCNSMPIIQLSYAECFSVQIQCTIKSQGGCQIKTDCNSYKQQSECLIDYNDSTCIWDDSLQQCFSDICQPQCGDGIVIYPYEECDDTNNLPYDGCYECKIQCSLGCLICEGQNCIKCNPNGWTLNHITSGCDSICGDGIITILEKCDDANFIQYDGCFQCDYQCSLECLNCYQGVCLECPYGFYSNNSFCKTQCGDSIVILEKEECDDGNLNDNDGCTQKCQIQDNWTCIIQDLQSLCFQLDFPLPLLQMINQNPSQLLFSFSQPVMLSQYSAQDFLKSISITISNLDKNQFNYVIIPLTEISKQLMNVNYTIQIQFQISIKNPIVNLQFDRNLVINEVFNKPYNNVTLKLSSIEQLTNLQQSITDTAAYFSSIVIYIFIAIAILSIFLGNFEIFWNLLDNLQQLSYIKYININYPVNFSVFLAIFDFVSLQPIQDYFNLDSIFQKFIKQDIPIVQYPIGKFRLFQTDCFFATNFQSFIIILITTIINFWISQLFIYILIKSKYSNIIVFVDSSIRLIITKLVAIIYALQQLALFFIKSFFFQGLIRIFLSSYYDLTFSSLLQIVTFSKSNTILYASSILSIVIFTFNLLSILGFYSYSLYSNNSIKILEQNMFFEGINLKINKWNAQYQTIVLLKKTIFISTLVLLQVIPICQTIFISFQSIIFILFIILSKPMIKGFENFKILIFEISIWLNSILFLCHDLDYFYEYRIQIGWINIGCFSINLSCCLIIDIYQQIKILKTKLYKPIAQKQNQINPNGFQMC
ncbi:unnamed protein product [Paramecium sonneborni]|uniref:PSI domain-containing protein n=1 Tax=Paramecium sonneborni TaxID=65129 RepID=A0A8S1NE44_9CILI|nr:unnamed protein product [Paramecium sonneborni]